MNLTKTLRRFLLPGFAITLICTSKFRAFVSPGAEVELSPFLQIGRGTKISSFTKIKAADGPLTIGARVSIGTGCFIHSSEGGVTIGDDCLISPNTSIVGSNYRFDRLDIPIQQQGDVSKGIRIGRDVWIGVGCAILDGAEIGNGAIITPNSVVTGTIPDNAVATGNPAKVIFTRRQ